MEQDIGARAMIELERAMARVGECDGVCWKERGEEHGKALMGREWESAMQGR